MPVQNGTVITTGSAARPQAAHKTMSSKFEVTKDVAGEVRIACRKYAGKTVHTILAQVRETGNDGDAEYSVDWTTDYQIVQCRGCMSVSYREASANSEDYDFDGDDGGIYYNVTETIYPPRLENARGLGDDALHLPLEIQRIYEETRIAMAGQTPVLAGVGLRALLETVCKAKNAKGRNLSVKVDALVEARVLTPERAAILHQIRTLGNAAAHQAKPHNVAQLSLALDIMENLLQDVYVLPQRAAAAFKTAPAVKEGGDEDGEADAD